uniref:hypothetical protein n=1 Tax=Candidatus Electronema sp. TaxID=2698783 RepID=UPI004057192C
MRFKILIIMLAVLLTGCNKMIDEGGTNSQYQHDMDILRMQDIKTIGGYIEDYKDKTGHYPLVRSDEIEQYVHIATDGQKKYIQGAPPEKHVVTDCADLDQELKRVLGKDIVIPKDPQKVPMNKPNFYIYMTRGKDYWLAVHLHSACSLSKQVAKYYHKLEISSNPYPPAMVWSYETLSENKEFVKEASRPFYKPEYIDYLRKGELPTAPSTTTE